MAKKIIKAQMKQRRDTRANWAATNPVLLDGELGIVSDDPNLYKVGDGTTAWNNLPFRGFDGTLVHETGSSDTAVMSQKAVTEALTDLEQELNDKVDNLPRGEEFDSKSRYPDMSVGFSDHLVGHGESTPSEFSFRASGGKSILDGAARVKELRGNAVVWNNTVELVNLPMTAAGVTATELEGRRIHLQGESTNEGDKNLYVLENKIFEGHYYAVILAGAKYYGIYGYGGIITNPTQGAVVQATGAISALTLLPISSLASGTAVDEIVGPRIHDLTLMFGAGNEPTTIEEFYARCPIGVDMNAYNEGELIPFTADAIKSVGDNAWDEEWEHGYITIDGENGYYDDNAIRCKGYIKALPNAAYHVHFNDARYIMVAYYDAEKHYIALDDPLYEDGIFTTPTNCHYVRFFCEEKSTYNNDITISLYHSGWKAEVDNVYKPYESFTREIDPRIKEAFPNGMKPWDKVYNKNGKGYIVKGTGEVDMGSLYIEYKVLNGVVGTWFVAYLEDGRISANTKIGIIPNYPYCSDNTGSSIYEGEEDRVYATNAGALGGSLGYSYICVRDSAYTDADTFKAAMAGVPLWYELAEPTIIEYDEPFNLDYEVWDFGTEETISENPSAPLSANIAYGFNATDTIRSNEARIAQLEAMIATMQAQMASMTTNE